MKLYEIRDLANQLIEKHLPNRGWSFDFDTAKRRMGCCNHRHKLITLSKVICRIASDEEITDTILHEIAHARVGPGYGHGPFWRAVAQQLGCTGERCHSVPTHQGAKYRAECDECGKTYHRHRKTAHLANGGYYRCSCGFSKMRFHPVT